MHDLGLREYLQILRRRKWIVLQALIIVPLAAVAFSLRQSALYQSSADVLLRYQSLPSTLRGISDPNSYSYYIDPTRPMATSLQVAELPALSRTASARRSASSGISTAESARRASAQVGNTDVMRFTAETGDPRPRQPNATEYARQFTIYYQQLDTSSITRAIRGPAAAHPTSAAEGTAHVPTAAATACSRRSTTLQTLLTLQTSSAVVVRQGTGAAKVRPTPKKYAHPRPRPRARARDRPRVPARRLRHAAALRAHIAARSSRCRSSHAPAAARTLERDQHLVMIADPMAQRRRRLPAAADEPRVRDRQARPR